MHVSGDIFIHLTIPYRWETVKHFVMRCWSILPYIVHVLIKDFMYIKLE